MAREKHGSHGVEEVLIVLKILLVFDQVKLKLLSNRLVQECLIVLNIID